MKEMDNLREEFSPYVQNSEVFFAGYVTILVCSR